VIDSRLHPAALEGSSAAIAIEFHMRLSGATMAGAPPAAPFAFALVARAFGPSLSALALDEHRVRGPCLV
jgi:hypothetical protein